MVKATKIHQKKQDQECKFHPSSKHQLKSAELMRCGGGIKIGPFFWRGHYRKWEHSIFGVKIASLASFKQAKIFPTKKNKSLVWLLQVISRVLTPLRPKIYPMPSMYGVSNIYHNTWPYVGCLDQSHGWYEYDYIFFNATRVANSWVHCGLKM